ncbi:MAG TPA: 4Fe-4S dicluster domain-containing protein [Chromatiales bacterium]|nr:4Fe-4S dicluster domain-containing protein [Chromatiales bacterium]
MDRRAFFRRALRKGGEQVVRHVERRVQRKAARWIRPPWAVPEVEFLLACTRCGACIEACPHGVVFPLPARLGAEVVATPALDLTTRGCHLCDDWPCVAACEPGALRFPTPPQEEEGGNEETAVPASPPRLARATIDTERCLPWQGPECGACAAVCPVPDALQWDGPRPHIDGARCVGCALCRAACITDPPAVRIASLQPSES